MNALRCACCVLLLEIVPSAFAVEPSDVVAIQQAVPDDAYLVVQGWHNPERDYQRAYLEDIWKTVQDEKLVERITDLITSHVSDEDLQTAQSAYHEVQDAVAPIDWKSLADCSEMVYAQVMEPPFTHHLALFKLTPQSAADAETGLKNLLNLVAEKSAGKVSVRTSTVESVELVTLDLPPEAPFHPALARVDDVLLISSSEALARRSLGMLLGSHEPSKFDDARLTEALKSLPKPEDSLVFFDGRQLFNQLRTMGTFIRAKAGDNPDAGRVATIVEKVLDELSVLDYEATVEYTDGYRNCATAYGVLLPDADQKILGKMVLGGKPFKDWQRWIPEDAVSYSLSTGVNLHPAYEGVLGILREQVPESNEEIKKFEQAQDEIGVHLDRDIFQAFSGESVSVTLPAASSAAAGGPESVYALRCQKPERIRELLHRLVDGLQQFPAVKAQQLSLSECKELEGFDELSATSLMMVGARPVIGFHEGWMLIGSSPSAVQRVLDTYAGKEPSIAKAQSFARFDLAIEGPVTGLSYRHLAEGTRQAAQMLRQIGLMAPMILGMAGAQAEPEDLKPVQDALALLPSIANVVGKFDYLEAMLSVTQQGQQPNSYQRRSVTLVRPPAKVEKDTEPQTADEASDEKPDE